MSLVAYGSSGESSDDEEEVKPAETEAIVTKDTEKPETNVIASQAQQNSIIHMNLPVPKYQQSSTKFDEAQNTDSNEHENKSRLKFDALPKPISVQYGYDDVVEDDDDVPLQFKPRDVVIEKMAKPDRAPVRISVPSLSDFKDVDEELEKSKSRRTASKKGTGLFALLPPPQSEVPSKKNNFIPHVLTKTPVNSVPKKTVPVTKVSAKIPEKPLINKVAVKSTKNPLAVLDYDSNSEDDEESDGKHDFFALTKPIPAPAPEVSSATNFFSIPDKPEHKQLMNSEIVEDIVNHTNPIGFASEVDEPKNSGKTLISTVMNMPREEILLKNKAEVGPKLPVPEQEYNVDSEGNVAFDDKAIEYLCGKRGIKRKNQMIDEANIIEINGEDIKPDEREWMVKALTEEPVQRPVSMQGAGPSSQSKKKHQITYLAHQAKAMEVELKNSWSQNRMARKQTQSKYGF